MTQDNLRPSGLKSRPRDRELFDRLLRDFVPDTPFDIHAHLYQVHDLEKGTRASAADDGVGWESYRENLTGWMGDRAPREALCFPFPARNADLHGANLFCLAETARSAQSRALLMVRPADDVAAIETLLNEHRAVVAGFKVYHVFADREDTFHATIGEFLPEWAWELANRHELAIMLHLVRSRALADLENQAYIRAHCAKYPRARLILAHAARGFCSLHTVEGIAALRGLGNVYFDNSAICEPASLLAILQAFGPRRLLFGTDFPVSNFQGRCSSVGDGFLWLYEQNVDWPEGGPGERTTVGSESLLALKQACQLAHLTDSDIERIFKTNAEELLGISPPSADASGRIYNRARRIIPGGSQLLSKRPEMFAPGVWPPYFAEAHGVEVVDVDGRAFIDMSTMSVGACLLGYADPDVDAAVCRRVMRGSMSTLNSDGEVELAEQLLAIHPWAAMVRYARGGGEALAVAVRIARASTGRTKVAFCGYHGWHDWYLAANLPAADTAPDALAGHLLGGLTPNGVPAELTDTALPFSYNCPQELEAIVRRHGDQLAAIVMEPTRHQSPEQGFLETVRKLADSAGAVLVFDEVSVAWRLCLGGAHLKYGVAPDIAVFSKAIANGYPMAAILGTEPVMQASQKSFISSTMWTDGIGPAAALAAIRIFQSQNIPEHVAAIGARYREGMREIALRHGVHLNFAGHAAISSLRFEHEHPSELQTLLTTLMIERGILVGPGFYPSLAHENRHVDACLEAASDVFQEIGAAVERGDAPLRLLGPVKHSGFERLA